MDKYIIVLVTAPSQKTAAGIAKMLVKSRLAACANIIPKVRSIYRWQGKLYDEPEVLMVIKTKKALFRRLAEKVRAIHPYQVPEIISLTITAGDKKYLQWLDETV